VIRTWLALAVLCAGTAWGAGPSYSAADILNASNYADSGYEPHKNSLMLDYSPSEFSRLRLQFARDSAREDATDHQIFLQYQTSLGAHGAHGY